MWNYKGAGNVGNYTLEEEWMPIEDASYCTQFPVKANPIARQLALNYLMDEVWDEVIQGHSIKKLCEKLSWIGLVTTAKYYWRKLGNIPITDDDALDLGFLHFHPGTPKLDIWHWFEATFDYPVHKLVFPEGEK